MDYIALALIAFIMVTGGFAFIWIMDRGGFRAQAPYDGEQFPELIDYDRPVDDESWRPE